MARNERKRVRDLADTLKWSLPKLNPRVEPLPPAEGAPEQGVTLDVVPGVRAVLFPMAEVWTGLLVSYDIVTGKVVQTLEHQEHVDTDEASPAWGARVVRDILTSVIANGAEGDTLERAQSLLERVEAAIPRL